MNIQSWFILGWAGSISLLSKGLSRVFCSTSLKASLLQHSFFVVQLSHPYVTTGKTFSSFISLVRLRIGLQEKSSLLEGNFFFFLTEIYPVIKRLDKNTYIMNSSFLSKYFFVFILLDIFTYNDLIYHLKISFISFLYITHCLFISIKSEIFWISFFTSYLPSSYFLSSTLPLS